jgi:uncharacterized protein (DUF2236 family)
VGGVVQAASHLYQGTDDQVLPLPEEWPRLALDPSSITWRRAGDSRLFLASGTALLYQVAHPTVGAGVSEHSNFAADPWGRLLRTLDFTNLLIYGGPERAAEIGARIREFHKRIKGRLPDGTPYHALEPEAYAWVHASLAESILAAHARFGRPFTLAEAERFWSEWRPLGRFLGVRWRDLPERYADYREYVAWIVDELLEHTSAVDEVLDALQQPPPPVKGVPPGVWRFASRPQVRLARLATVGLLPPRLRARLGLEWTPAKDAELRLLGRASRAMTPVMPRTLRNLGPSYLRWRREQIARGDVASLEHSPHLAG